MTIASSQPAPRPVSAAGATPLPAKDDLLTVFSIAALAFVITDTLQQALGHALPALLTISPFGMLTAAGWSSAYDNTLIDVGGCLVNFIVALLAVASLIAWKRGAPRARLLLLLVCAFNLLAGSGYLLFAALTGFGDWYSLLDGHTTWNMLRILLLVAGALLWIASVFIVGSLLGRQFGFPRSARRRIVHLTLCSWLATILVAVLASAVNRIGVRFILLSDFPATTLAQIGLLFVPLCVHGHPARDAAAAEPIARNWSWIAISAALTIAFVLILGRGIALHGKLQ